MKTQDIHSLQCGCACRFVDYQLGHWTSPAVDLQYFLHSSVSLDLLDKHHILVEEYHKSLTQTLSALAYQGLQPSLDQLKQQLQKKGLFSVLVSCAFLPVFLVDRSNVPDVTDLMNNTGKVYLSKEYKRAIKKLLPVFEEKGWL